IASEITVYLVGGQFMKEEQSILGEGAISSSNSFNYDIAFIGAGGVTMEEGLTEYYPQTAQLCRTIIKRSRMTVLLCDSSKFGVTQFAITDILPTVHTIITDKNIPKEYEDGVSDLGINLVKV
ncbi:MAG: DeoR/GlpR transcriptional regulator, partial [Sphaerochaetaceae bacterium]|nr:DeoR/GlpR transcriptional regulator [Sphaerochaetaceae bacterium]